MTTGTKLVQGSGAKFSVSIYLLPNGSVDPPSVDSESVTLAGAVAQGATSITLSTSLTEQLAEGSVLEFMDGSVKKPVIVSEDAYQTSTVNIIPSPHSTIADLSTANAVYKLKVQGSTDFNATLSSDVTNSTTHADALGFQNSVVTTQSFEVPVTANYLADDSATNIIEKAAREAVNRQIYVWLQDPPPQFYDIGKVTRFVAIVTNFDRATPAADIVTWTSTFLSQGAPIYDDPIFTP